MEFRELSSCSVHHIYKCSTCWLKSTIIISQARSSPPIRFSEFDSPSIYCWFSSSIHALHEFDSGHIYGTNTCFITEITPPTALLATLSTGESPIEPSPQELARTQIEAAKVEKDREIACEELDKYFTAPLEPADINGVTLVRYCDVSNSICLQYLCSQCVSSMKRSFPSISNRTRCFTSPVIRCSM